MKNKVCTKCNKRKPITEFHKRSCSRDGLCYLCKKCLLDRVKKYQNRNREKVRKYNREKRKRDREDPEYRKKEKQYYQEWYQRNGRNRAVDYVEAIIEWKRNHPEAVKAQYLLRQAVKNGQVVKPLNCSKCQKQLRLSAHHKDYNKPLEVMWLCSTCHKNIHTKKGS